MSKRPLQRAIDRIRERALEAAEGDFNGVYERIGAQIALRRGELDLSQRELAELCATTQSAIARLEAGRRAPRIDTLLRVANALDCELDVELLPRTTRNEGEPREGNR